MFAIRIYSPHIITPATALVSEMDNFDADETEQFTNLNVLLAEDVAANILVATTWLEIFGCSYQVAETGKEVLKKIAEHKFDIVLMDIQMPEMDGLQATAHIREQERATNSLRLPIIAMTAHALAGDEQRCLSAGMDGYIPKPFNMDQLAVLLKRLSAKKQQSEPI